MKLVLQFGLIILSCLPLLWLSFSLLDHYSMESSLIEISGVEIALLLASLGLPLLVIKKFGANWRDNPENY